MSGEQRLSVHEVDPKAYEAVRGLERYVRAGNLEPRLLSLIKIRASQLNGCAYCLDMHAGEARAVGENQRRLDILAAWREASGMFSDRERAALAFTEAVTLIGEAGVPDAVWEDVTRSFDQNEVVRLLLAIAAINVWNRLAVATHQELPNRD
ncbi:carboxymuconolactone decarboxylase family protein [Nitrolancea hollandica]|uniref:Alkylhydroperoxidase like protein, AhpD family n=1 Tax=Nitrolancea hollandica Lb TaxID=1129897 RepID=I4EKT0_9BACT|nr:carboxymuconolactone decarboxylase family protein [Nitrolancea hollandica]CCF85292.1 Alkylhydroperoxidase like protein, AhpD family [Nitrolancea hollandica Lb]